MDLFLNSETFTSSGKPDALLMDLNALMQWKSRIVAHQKRARENKPELQGTLFDLAPTHVDPDAIDPLSQRLCPMSFYRLPVDGPGASCIYFVIDSAAKLVLYVGETSRSNLRWKGVHDTKRYLSRYQDLHYQYGLKTAINMAFWWDAPAQTKPRQQLELSLIKRWRSPFNKENWSLWGWGAPFKG